MSAEQPQLHDSTPHTIPEGYDFGQVDYLDDTVAESLANHELARALGHEAVKADVETQHDAAAKGLLLAMELQLADVPAETRVWGVSPDQANEPDARRMGDSMRTLHLYDPAAGGAAIIESGLNDGIGYHRLMGATPKDHRLPTPGRIGRWRGQQTPPAPALTHGVSIGFNAATGEASGLPDDSTEIEAINTAVSRSVPIDSGLFYGYDRLLRGQLEGKANKAERQNVEAGLAAAVRAHAERAQVEETQQRAINTAGETLAAELEAGAQGATDARPPVTPAA